MRFVTWLLIVVVVVMGSAGDVLCAKGMASGGEINFAPAGLGRLLRSIAVRRMVILGWICDAISFFCLLALFSVTQLSIAVPATALSFVVDTLGARFLLHEHVHWKRWLGVLLVTAGVMLTVQSGNGKVLTAGGNHLPMQKVEKMRSRMSSAVVWPVRLSSARRAP